MKVKPFSAVVAILLGAFVAFYHPEQAVAQAVSRAFLTNSGNPIAWTATAAGYANVSIAGGAVTAPFTINGDGIATTATDGLLIANSTPATAGVPVQYADRIRVCGTGYNSVSTLSETNCWSIENRPTTAAGATGTSLWFARSLNGGAYVDEFQFRQDGTFIVPNSQVSSAGVNVNGSGTTFQLTGKNLAVNTAPTVTSAGTSPSIVAANGSAAFTVNVGTGGTATTIVLAMPTATSGWNCAPVNLTAAAANRANQNVVQQSSTTTSVTLQNQTPSTGAAVAFTASDIVSVACLGR